MTKRRATILCCLCCCLALFSSLFFSRLPVASADVVVYEQMSQADTRILLGDTIPFNYVIGGVTGSANFVYTGTYCALTQANIGTNSCFTSGSYNFNSQNGKWLVYSSDTNDYSLSNKVCQISFDLDIYSSADSQFYGAFALPISQSVYQSPISSDNSFSTYPFNFVNGLTDCPATPFSDNSPNNDYYNTSMFIYQNFLNNVMSNQYFRLFPYDNQESVTAVVADGVVFPYQKMVLLVYCPYVYGSLTPDNPATGTTTTGTGSADWANVESGINQMNSGMDDLNSGMDDLNSGMDDLNSGIDDMHSDIVGGVSDIVSALIVPQDSLGDLVLDPIDTLPHEYDYDDIIDTAAEVIEDIPPGIVGAASLWGMLDMLFGVDSTFIWLIPLAVFMAIAAWVLYRTG